MLDLKNVNTCKTHTRKLVLVWMVMDFITAMKLSTAPSLCIKPLNYPEGTCLGNECIYARYVCYGVILGLRSSTCLQYLCSVPYSHPEVALYNRGNGSLFHVYSLSYLNGLKLSMQGELDELEREEFFRLKKIQGKKQRDLDKVEQEKVRGSKWKGLELACVPLSFIA